MSHDKTGDFEWLLQGADHRGGEMEAHGRDMSERLDSDGKSESMRGEEDREVQGMRACVGM